jgi:hypothetical protein
MPECVTGNNGPLAKRQLRFSSHIAMSRRAICCDVLIVVSTVLRIKRTLDGAEIDTIV